MSQATSTDQFISDLKELTTKDCTYNCYVIKNCKNGFVGTSVELPNSHLKFYMNKTINFLCDEYKKMSIDEYPIAAPKDFIETIPCTSPTISNAIKSLRDTINNEETNHNDPTNYKSAYLITVDIDESTIIFLTKKNLINTYQKKYLFTRLNGEKYKLLTNDLVQLVMHFDCIIMNDICYIITIQGRKLFRLEDIAQKQSLDTKNKLVLNHLIAQDDEEIVTNYISKSKNYSSLANPDEKIIEELSHVNHKNKKKIEEKYKLKFVEKAGILSIDLSSEEKIKNFTDTITHKRALNFDRNPINLKAPYKTN